jgi:hypothetical protein
MLILIGYWHSDDAPRWPRPVEFVDPTWNANERARVIDHLRRGSVARAYLGRSTCRICGDAVGALELSDGMFIWPEGLLHYVEAHDVRLPQRFVDNVGQILDVSEDEQVDQSWWLEIGDTHR